MASTTARPHCEYCWCHALFDGLQISVPDTSTVASMYPTLTPMACIAPSFKLDRLNAGMLHVEPGTSLEIPVGPKTSSSLRVSIVLHRAQSSNQRFPQRLENMMITATGTSLRVGKIWLFIKKKRITSVSADMLIHILA